MVFLCFISFLGVLKVILKMPPKKKQKRMPAATDRQTRSRSHENDSVDDIQEATEGETTKEATEEVTQEATMETTEEATAEATQEATMEATQEDITTIGTQEATEESKWTVALFKEEDELKLVEFLKDNELLHNKKLMDSKDPNKWEALLDKFCTENNMDKAACKEWFQSQRTMYGKITHMKPGHGVPIYTCRHTWLKKNLGFLHTRIVGIIWQRVPSRQPVKQQCHLRHPMMDHQQKSHINPQSESPGQWSWQWTWIY